MFSKFWHIQKMQREINSKKYKQRALQNNEKA